MTAAASEPEGTAREGSNLALYRKYRPATFAEVKGQEHVTAPLMQALRTGRIHHAYLFSGPRGCGKTSSARILARSLNCVNGPTPEPCGVCDSCVALAPSGPGSIDVIEIDAASHGGVDDARELRERAFYTPVSGRFKIYIIDEAHMVTQQGFNALLKLVEEPPPHLKFIFATTEPEKVIPTIRSRTHHYPFRLVPPSVLRELMQDILRSEGVAVEEAVLPLVVRAGAGSVRDSLSVLDQLLAGSDETGLRYDRAVALLGFTDASLLDEITDAFAASDGAAVFRVINRVIEGGHEPRRFAADLLDRFRDLIVLAAVPDAAESGLLDVSPDRAERLAGQAGRFGRAGLTRAADIISAGLDQMRGATSPRLLLELMCAQVLLPAAATDEKSLLARLERLEAGVRAAPAPAPQSQPPAPPAGKDDYPERPRRVTSPERSVPQPARPAAPAPPAAPAEGQQTADSLRGNWDAVLEAVKRERRVAWILLGSASVHSLHEGILTLRFTRDGDLKAFNSSGHDAILKKVLSTGFGLNVTVKGVVGAGAGPVAAGPGGGRPGAVGGSGRGAGYGSAAGASGTGGFSGTGGAGRVGGTAGSGRGGEAGTGGAAAPGSPRGSTAPEPGGRHDDLSDDLPPEPDDMADDLSPDEPEPDDWSAGKRPAEGRSAGAPAELTGMDLIQRELGGQVIREIEG